MNPPPTPIRLVSAPIAVPHASDFHGMPCARTSFRVGSLVPADDPHIRYAATNATKVNSSTCSRGSMRTATGAASCDPTMPAPPKMTTRCQSTRPRSADHAPDEAATAPVTASASRNADFDG